MKSLHVPFHFYPDAVGGTEVYVLALARQLRNSGHEVNIAAPGERREHYSHEGIPVHRFTTGKLKDISGLYGDGDKFAAQQFAEILDETEPELVHLHGVSPATSVKVIREIKSRRIPVVLTVHIPGILCSRGTMLRYGAEVCDGVIEVRKCSRCVLHAHGMNRPLAQLVGTMPISLCKALAVTGHQAGWITALRMTELMSLRQGAIQKALNEVDHVIAVCDWMRRALLTNGVPAWKLTLCRHGVTQSALRPAERASAPESAIKRIAFLGRLNEAKGAHVLVDAVLSSPDLPLLLDVYGIVQDAPGSEYAQRLVSQSSHDPRIQFLAPVENSKVPETLSSYDAVAIPSLGMETGPLVVYDAFVMGVPVIGSRQGGIAELVSHEINGLLVDPPQNVRAWSAALYRICNEPGLTHKLRQGVTEPRSMNEVADTTLQIYELLLDRRPLPVHHSSK
jgi:glycosyltransferase involved in cell wall biosynthesis